MWRKATIEGRELEILRAVKEDVNYTLWNSNMEPTEGPLYLYEENA